MLAAAIDFLRRKKPRGNGLATGLFGALIASELLQHEKQIGTWSSQSTDESCVYPYRHAGIGSAQTDPTFPFLETPHAEDESD